MTAITRSSISDKVQPIKLEKEPSSPVPSHFTMSEPGSSSNDQVTENVRWLEQEEKRNENQKESPRKSVIDEKDQLTMDLVYFKSKDDSDVETSLPETPRKDTVKPDTPTNILQTAADSKQKPENQDSSKFS